ncbi:inner-membrane translocator [Cellulomonas flavigena DSM 20109]|uniref:Xylose transport system permease protein XylH n=1 Tax=Cellulomonas flavigena (strain ATCC 482 / DSM 20109 / BCRC 11376 / JCM 18109 / NBRC 3775 / NCIMB 8073 / NRS 134) TaxID=446466 RepID=D5UCP5_CELFN|nr:sugar ABC transporter permease [Cellulomonas flavigena]ADG76280.1 inner-membrane translocator [Cellulomonas flavigena DSM 20109]
MTSFKQVLGGDVRQFTMVFALVALLVAFDVASGGRMLTSSNFQNLLSGNAYVLILAIGMVMVIVIGQIDLSVGSVAGFVGMVVALSARDLNLPWWAAVLVGLAVGTAIGCWQGFWLARLGIPGFITTLAGMMIFRGAVIWISGSISVPVPPELRFLGSGYLPEWGPAFTQMNNSTLLLGLIAIGVYGYSQLTQHRRAAASGDRAEPLWPVVVRVVLVGAVIAYVTWLFGSGRPGTSFPVPGLILVGLVIVYHVVTQRTRFGRHIYAVGGNRAAAALSGVNTRRTYFLVMANMSFLAALAGIMFVGRATSAGPSDGTMWELDAIAAVFIGGAAVSGGIGTVTASMVGGLVMAVLNSGLMLMGVGADRTQVIKGVVLLAAVAFDVYNKQQGRPSITGLLWERLSRGGTTQGGPDAAAAVAASTATAPPALGPVEPEGDAPVVPAEDRASTGRAG